MFFGSMRNCDFMFQATAPNAFLHAGGRLGMVGSAHVRGVKPHWGEVPPGRPRNIAARDQALGLRVQSCAAVVSQESR